MKHILLLLLSFPLMLAAQSTLDISFDPDVATINMELDASNEFQSIENEGYLHNLGSDVVNLRWSYELTGAPADWVITLCDDQNCYFGQSSSNFTNPEPLPISVDDYSIWKLGVKPKLQTGCGTIVFSFFDDSDLSTVIYTEEFEICVFDPVSTNDFEAQVADLSVYPNPVRSTLNISDDSIVDEVVVYNLLGKPVKRFDMNANNSLDLGDLRDGVYLVGLYNEEQGLLKTSRVLKKNSRP
jgi:hypothetical protein